MNAKIEEIYVRGKLAGTITVRSNGFEVRGPGVPVDSTTGWVRHKTRREALAALRRAGE